MFQTKVNLMESVMKDLNTPNPVSPPTSQLHTMPIPASHVSESSLPATAVLLTHLFCYLLLYQSRKFLWLYLLIHLGPKHELNGWSIFCISIFLLVKIFLKLHIADCCCCGVNLVSFVRPLQAEICSRHEFWWWQVVASSGGGGGVVQYRTTEAVQRLPSHETRLGATTD